MGTYVNPPNETKEQYLERVGIKMNSIDHLRDVPLNHALVCLVENPQFSAALWVCSKHQLALTKSDDDPRPRTYYVVPINAEFKSAILTTTKENIYQRELENCKEARAGS